MNTQGALKIATRELDSLRGHFLDILTILPPASARAAVNATKIISKLSPVLGNWAEFCTVDLLNDRPDFAALGRWRRQDPGFPDVIFDGKIAPAPGFEIKAWFPFATEITGRFKDSRDHFASDQTYLALMAWLPEHLVYGRPRILDVCVVSGRSLAEARDAHYHNPPDYLVIEPGDTSKRTRNLQQTNTNGFKLQGTTETMKLAEAVVTTWGPDGRTYSTHVTYQEKLVALMGQFKYRGDTNYAKMDRVVHTGVEQFKTTVMGTTVHGMTVKQWSRVFASEDDAVIERALKTHLGLK